MLDEEDICAHEENSIVCLNHIQGETLFIVFTLTEEMKLPMCVCVFVVHLVLNDPSLSFKEGAG